MFLTVAHKRYELLFTPKLPCFGICSPPDDSGKKIEIRASLKGQALLSTLLHELLHAADWTKDEEWIDQTGEDLARALWRLGYRRMSEPAAE